MAGYENSNPIEIADKEIDLYAVLGKVGIQFEHYRGTTGKLYCPFGGISHIDGGRDAAMRVYADTNTAWCFGCDFYFTPTTLWAAWIDVSRTEAAELLLDESGFKPETYEEKWERLIQAESEFRVEDIQKALDTACQRKDPLWNIHVTMSPLKEEYRKWIQLLDKVNDQDKAEKWLKAAKRKLFEVIQ